MGTCSWPCGKHSPDANPHPDPSQILARVQPNARVHTAHAHLLHVPARHIQQGLPHNSSAHNSSAMKDRPTISDLNPEPVAGPAFVDTETMALGLGRVKLSAQVQERDLFIDAGWHYGFLFIYSGWHYRFLLEFTS